jgi:hypothetical protein
VAFISTLWSLDSKKDDEFEVNVGKVSICEQTIADCDGTFGRAMPVCPHEP